MHTYSFEKLETWQKARIFRKEIYLLVKKLPKEEVFGLVSQIKRSSSSIGDCLAEGLQAELRQRIKLISSQCRIQVPLRLSITLSVLMI